MFTVIALVLIVFWLIGIIKPHYISAVIYTLPVIATLMIMVSGHRGRLNNPNNNLIQY